MSYKIYFWILLVISGVLFFAPITAEEQVGLGPDKVAHFILFLALYYLGIKGYLRSFKTLLISLAVYVVVVEIIQGGFLPYRSFDPLDAVAGYIGLVVGYLLIKKSG